MIQKVTKAVMGWQEKCEFYNVDRGLVVAFSPEKNGIAASIESKFLTTSGILFQM
jgi:hypothetical protein